jgi:hypothetical protein
VENASPERPFFELASLVDDLSGREAADLVADFSLRLLSVTPRKPDVPISDMDVAISASPSESLLSRLSWAEILTLLRRAGSGSPKLRHSELALLAAWAFSGGNPDIDIPPPHAMALLGADNDQRSRSFRELAAEGSVVPAPTERRFRLTETGRERAEALAARTFRPT